MFGSKIIPPKQANYVQGGGGGGQGPLGQMGSQMAMMGIKSALSGSPLAPMAGVLGGLFNDGGKVSLAEQINWGGKYSKPKPKPERKWYDPRGWVGLNDGGMAGGPLSQMPRMPHPNPQGYNEGGAVGQTPMKLVMDEQKLDQNAMAFELDQQRKDEKHQLDMKIKQEQFELAQKMKKAGAMTNRTAAKPQGPLAKKKATA